MSFTIETVSEGDYDEYEFWTCENCGRHYCLAGVGGDLACCECEFEHEGEY